MNELEKLLEIEQKSNRVDFLYKTSDTKIGYLEISISNGTTTIENNIIDQVYLKDEVDDFEKTARPGYLEKRNKK